MALEVGSRLGHYEVTALIGEGGMGQVYQARDTTLDRDVALKVLPDAFTADPDRLARFEREAKVLASLNHPNIGAIYGLEKSGDTRALVLELIEGPTLADRIKRGAIPLDEALPIAKQIAEALEAAHEAGVIHRDLKPANIKVRDDGTVKVLDFGLAKALNPLPEGDASQSPTLTAAATQMGVIMGTAAYMSPEQARGKTVDKRADIWSFGVVLYEMLTGKRVFESDDVSLTLADVMRAEPAWERLPKGLSPALRTFLERCLEKDPRQRVRDIGDVRLVLEGAFETNVSAPAEVTSPQPAGWQRVTPWVTGVVLGGVVVGLIVWSLLGSRPPSVELTRRFVIAQSSSDVMTADAPGNLFALSPDGRTLVYRGANEGGTQLYRRSLDQFEAVPLPDTEGAVDPFFSPNGQWVAFLAGADGPLRKVSLVGGSPLTVMEATPMWGATWGADDTIVLGTVNGGLFRVSANGGEPQPLTTAESEIEPHRDPHFLPGGRALLFSVGNMRASSIVVYSMETGESQELAVEGRRPRYSSGHITFVRGVSLWAVSFDPRRFTVTGDPFRVLESLAAPQRGVSLPQFDAAYDGTLAYIPEGAIETRLVETLDWVDREGNLTPLREDLQAYSGPRFSPDGSQILFQCGASLSDTGCGGAGVQVWMRDVERGVATPVTFEGFNMNPVWTPDGEAVTFTSSRGDGSLPVLYQKRLDGSGEAELLSDNDGRPSSWSPDGAVLAFSQGRVGMDTDIWVLEDGTPRAFIATNAEESWAMFSPDGQWMAYGSDKSGQDEVYLRPYPGPGEEQQVSTDGGGEPRWSPEGRELFYRTRAGEVLSVAVQTTPSVELGTPQLLFEVPNMRGLAHFGSFDVHPDGERFVVVRSVGTDSSTTQINVVLNWTEELTDRVPVD